MRGFSTHQGAYSPKVSVLLSNFRTRYIPFLFSLLVVIFAPCVSVSLASAQQITLAVTPSSVTLATGVAQQFTATVQGTPRTGVIWSASAGTITSSGLFTAPATPSTSAITITATSAADPTKSASATVAVINRPAAPAINTGTEPTGMQPSGTTADSQSQHGQYDGPAELPRVYVSSAMSDTPSPGKTWSVAAGGDFQQALNQAACGDTIALEAGATFSANVIVPAKSCDNSHWITVRTSAPDSSLPTEGTRLTPCYAGVKSLPGRPPYNCTSPRNVMAKVVFSKKTGDGPIVFAPGANHYRFIGLEITRNVNTPIVYSLMSMTSGSTADHLVFDRMWVHGTAQDDTAKGLQLGGSTTVALVDSYFSDFHCTAGTGACTDAVAIGGGIGDNPMGPYKIVDNFLEASGENILFGGAPATQTPGDIEIRFNHMFKPLTWMKGQKGFVGGQSGHPFVVKNLFELKNAQRVLLEGNVMEDSWGGFSQEGFGILLTPKNQINDKGKSCPLCQVTDVTVRYNTISHVASGMQIGNGLSGKGGAAQAGERYSIHDIVIDGIDAKVYNGSGMLAQVSMGQGNSPILHDVTIQHITAFPSDVMLNIGDKTANKMFGFTFVNNMISATNRPFTSTGGNGNCAAHTKPTSMLDSCFSSYQFTTNAVIAIPPSLPASDWPYGNQFPKAPQGLFVNYNNGDGGDYHLAPGSPYKNAGTDGKDLGADIDAVNSYTANSR